MKKTGRKLKKLRTDNGFTQADIAELLNISRPTMAAIESGNRDLGIQEALKIAAKFNLSIDELVGHEKNDVADIFNWAKFKEGILLALLAVGAMPNFGDTVLCKLIYFSDADHLAIKGTPIFGCKYIANHFGPTPIQLPKALEMLGKGREIYSVQEEYFEYRQTKHMPLRMADERHFKASELEVMKAVFSKYKVYSAREISDHSHDDPPWLETEPQQEIDLTLVHKRKGNMKCEVRYGTKIVDRIKQA